MNKIYDFCLSSLNLTLLYSEETGFILAARNGQLNILQFLITKGSSVDEKDINGKKQILHIIYIYVSIFLFIYI